MARNLVLFFVCPLIVCPLYVLSSSSLWAHEGHSHGHLHTRSSDQESQDSENHENVELGDDSEKNEAAKIVDETRSQISLKRPSAAAFQLFSKSVTAKVSGRYLLVECDGLPNHDMMIGIRAWQQQVPLPQPFVGENAWRIPLNPTISDDPISVLKSPLRGAIALAVNGVPIFCALNNRGEDTYLAGELDNWGGHCGRGDDYHYHTAPIHLEKKVGVGNPIAYALDGYPILGLTEADGSAPSGLDQFNGHFDDQGNYHYHASKTFPYVNGGLKGVVELRGDQIEQPKDSPVRPGQDPLRGAIITGFQRNGNHFEVSYQVSGNRENVRYSVDEDSVEFTWTNPLGTKKQTYRRSRIQEGPQRNLGIWFYITAGSLLGFVLVGSILVFRKVR